jgi:4-hydroxymandelate oxidase
VVPGVAADLAELEARARAAMAPPAWDYVAGGSGDEATLAANVAAWRALWVRPRVLRDMSQASAAVELLGARWAAPVGVAPVAAHQLAHPDGERATALACAAAGVPFCLSTAATTDLAEVPAAGERWFQLYVRVDRERTRRILERLRPHGYRRVVLTVDLPVISERRREHRHPGWELPLVSHLAPGEPAGDRDKPGSGGWDPAVTADDVAWVAEASGLPVVVKGVLRGDDAVLALDAGAEAVWVSNHGGRQLDGALPTASALPEVAGAVAGRAPVLVDGGVRAGVDVVRALALGADAAFVGRPVLYALAAAGREGAEAYLRWLVEDVARALALSGCRSPAEATPDLLALAGG